MSDQKPSVAGVIAPPPLLLLAAFLLGLALDRLVPVGLVRAVPALPRYGAGALLILAATAVAVPAMLLFARAGTPRAPWRATTALVTQGVFAHVRNPMYTGMYLLLAGLALVLASDWLVATMIALALVIHFGVVKREERYLLTLFGEDYRAYMARVPRYGWKF